MTFSPLLAISPLDGRYYPLLESLRTITSEYALIKNRVIVEIEWLITLCNESKIKDIQTPSPSQITQLRNIGADFDIQAAQQIKHIENETKHDVKAVEYYLRDCLTNALQLPQLVPFIHFACTSEDINNLAYALMLNNARKQVLLPSINNIIDKLTTMAAEYANLPMLSRTHGQAATPTTLGKECINFTARLQKQHQLLSQCAISGKYNGAVGNLNAHHLAYPDVDWLQLTRKFVNRFGLEWNAYTTQIEPHDNLAEILHILSRINTIFIDMNRDIWGYIALGYFKQQPKAGEVGSSTMPHKVNPIDFENAEGNLGIANALIAHLANKLPISRFQRDLSDSTVLRNIGNLLGHSHLAYQYTLKGLQKLTVDPQALESDLQAHWEVLAEAIQTMMRRYGIADAYEQLKAFTRGQPVNQSRLQAFIQQTHLPESVKNNLLSLIPSSYLGYATQLVTQAVKTPTENKGIN